MGTVPVLEALISYRYRDYASVNGICVVNLDPILLARSRRVTTYERIAYYSL